MTNNELALKKAQYLLSSPEGEALLEELGEFWNPTQMFDIDPNQLAYNCGLRDAYHFLVALKNGELNDV